MPQQDEYGFWKDDRDRSLTGPIPRLSRGSRSPSQPATGSNPRVHRTHGADDRSVEIAYSAQEWAEHELDDEVWNDRAWTGSSLISRRGADRPPNFVMRRIAALVVLGVVATPIALLMSSSDETDPRVTSTETPSDLQIIDPSTSVLAAVIAPVATAETPAAAASVIVATQASLAQTPAAQMPVTQPTTTPSAAAAPPATTAAAQSTPPTSPRTEGPAAVSSAGSTDSPASTGSTADAVDEAANPTTAVERNCANDYEIVTGDYWILIAEKVSVRLADVLKANDATVDTPLYPGRTICLPANASSPTTDAPATTEAPTTTAQATTTTVKATTAAASTTTTSPPATTAAPPTTATPPKNTYTRAEVEQIIRDVWPDELEVEAIRIATRESNLIPTVRNYCCFGLFQMYWNVHKSWMTSAGVTSSDQLYDPRVNAYLAYSLYLHSGGWGPWAL